MESILIITKIEYDSEEECFIINPERRGTTIDGEIISCPPKQGFQTMKEKVLQKVSDQLDQWEQGLFPPEPETNEEEE